MGGEEEREGGVFDMWKDMSRGMWSCRVYMIFLLARRLPPFLKKCLMFLRKHLQFAKMEAPPPTQKEGGERERTNIRRATERETETEVGKRRDIEIEGF